MTVWISASASQYRRPHQLRSRSRSNGRPSSGGDCRAVVFQVMETVIEVIGVRLAGYVAGEFLQEGHGDNGTWIANPCSDQSRLLPNAFVESVLDFRLVEIVEQGEARRGVAHTKHRPEDHHEFMVWVEFEDAVDARGQLVVITHLSDIVDLVADMNE